MADNRSADIIVQRRDLEVTLPPEPTKRPQPSWPDSHQGTCREGPWPYSGSWCALRNKSALNVKRERYLSQAPALRLFLDPTP